MPDISKIKIEDTEYEIKDAEVWKLLWGSLEPQSQENTNCDEEEK